MDYHGCFRVSFWIKPPSGDVFTDINLAGRLLGGSLCREER